MNPFSENQPLRCCLALAALFTLASWTALEAQTVWQSWSHPSAAASPLPIDRGAAGLWQTLMKLRSRASLLMVVAHPDDEDGGLLAYESRGQGARTILLTLNRGEGGQNVMSSAYWDALGVLRTEELLAADRYYGAQQYFTRVVDFGFSKTKQESMEKWGHERVLEDAVRVVRMTRPLVIISVWVGGPSDGHGQHEVAGEIAQELFKAAADPHVFPDQVQAGLLPWQALKVYARVPFVAVTKKGMYDYASRRWYPVGVYDYIHHRFLPGVPATNVVVPEGQYNPILGSSYVQIGAQGLTRQKSQNGGFGIPPLGKRVARYHRYVSIPAVPAAESSFFDGINTSVEGIASLAPNAAFLRSGLSSINGDVEKAIHHFSGQHPEQVAPALAAGMEATHELIQHEEASALSSEAKYNVAFELRVKENEFNTALIQALGLGIRATVTPSPKQSQPRFGFGLPSTFPVAVPGQSFWVKVRLVNPSRAPLTVKQISLRAPTGEGWSCRAVAPAKHENNPLAPVGERVSRLAGRVRGSWPKFSEPACSMEPQAQASGKLLGNQPLTSVFRVTVPADASFTQPYYSRPNVEQPYYNILDKRDLNLPFAPYPLSAWAKFEFQGAPIRMGQVVQTVQRERSPGTVLNPLVVGPAISVELSPHAGILPLGTRTTSLTVTLHNTTTGHADGSVSLHLPAGWSSMPATARFKIAKAGEDAKFAFRVIASHPEQKPYTIRAVAQFDGRKYQKGYETVGYTGLRPYNFYRAAASRITGVEISIPKGLNVGYVTGTGDRVPQALESLGIKVHLLSSQDLATGNLQPYDAIVLGVRAYAARDDVKTYNSRLLDYVKNGGVLVVQYNTSEFDHNYGPYPYSLTRNPEVVVDEDSKVNILEPSNPLLSWPNKITEKDFEGWVEERGHSFMTSWDPRYQALLETHDPGQPPQKGGLLYAVYGKGVYIYDAYALYRQLPEGVPGAYRLFVNMVSLDRNPAR